MQSYQHEFERVEDYLHHRSPYLLVERIVEIRDREIHAEKIITGDEFFLAGHFPGAPIFPGAMMQELTTQTAGILIAAKYNPMQVYNTEDPTFNQYALGVLVATEQARYKGFARPGEKLSVRVSLIEHVSGLFEFEGEIKAARRLIMNNKFRLMNIKSNMLFEH